MLKIKEWLKKNGSKIFNSHKKLVIFLQHYV